MKKVTIVMYHYVRDMHNTAYPGIKALDIQDFSRQLAYIDKNHTVVTMEDVFAAIDENRKLPSNALLLTFDDGYKDHFEHVLPFLKKHRFQGSFFTPVKVITDGHVLDVNKIHYILASVEIKDLTKRLLELVKERRKLYNLPPDDYFYKHSAEKNRYDSPQVMLVKRMLQRDLPEVVRHEITEQLFAEFVSEDEKLFANQLYMNEKELKQLIEEGMYVGAHGYDHRFLTHLSEKECEFEIDQSLLFLKSLGIDTSQWAMCYPYGFYNDMVINLLKKKKCTLGLSIEVGVADLEKDNVFALPRLDTKDVPLL